MSTECPCCEGDHTTGHHLECTFFHDGPEEFARLEAAWTWLREIAALRAQLAASEDSRTAAHAAVKLFADNHAVEEVRVGGVIRALHHEIAALREAVRDSSDFFNGDPGYPQWACRPAVRRALEEKR